MGICISISASLFEFLTRCQRSSKGFIHRANRILSNLPQAAAKWSYDTDSKLIEVVFSAGSTDKFHLCWWPALWDHLLDRIWSLETLHGVLNCYHLWQNMSHITSTSSDPTKLISFFQMVPSSIKKSFCIAKGLVISSKLTAPCSPSSALSNEPNPIALAP